MGNNQDEKYRVLSRIELKPKVQYEDTEDNIVIHLHGSIVSEIPINPYTGKEQSGNYILVRDIENILQQIEKTKPIKIYFSSTGGDISSAIKIANSLITLNNSISLYVTAIAGAEAMLIATSADTVYMYPNSIMLIDRAKTTVLGNTERFEAVSEQLQQTDYSIEKHYQKRFKGSLNELRKLMKDGTFLTSDECLELGFADYVVSDINNGNSELKNDILSKFERTNEQKSILNKFKK